MAYNLNTPREMYIVVDAAGNVHTGGYRAGTGPKFYTKGSAQRIANTHNNQIDKYAGEFDADGSLKAKIGTKTRPYKYSPNYEVEYTQQNYDNAKRQHESYSKYYPESTRKYVKRVEVAIVPDPLESALKKYIQESAESNSTTFSPAAINTVVKDIMNIISKTK